MSKCIRWIALLVLLVLLAAPALAQGRVIVEDTTGRVDKATVEQAAQDLVRKNATVIVLVSDRTGGDPQTYARQRLSANGIQADPLDPSAIVYLVALDQRNAFIYYGADWNDELGSTYKTIVDRDMIPQLARNNLTEGIVAGIRGTVTATQPDPVDDRGADRRGHSSGGFLALIQPAPLGRAGAGERARIRRAIPPPGRRGDRRYGPGAARCWREGRVR